MKHGVILFETANSPLHPPFPPDKFVVVSVKCTTIWCKIIHSVRMLYCHNFVLWYIWELKWISEFLTSFWSKITLAVAWKRNLRISLWPNDAYFSYIFPSLLYAHTLARRIHKPQDGLTQFVVIYVPVILVPRTILSPYLNEWSSPIF